MRILLVEDEESKRRQVTELLDSHFSHAQVTEARSLQSALRQIVANTYDLVILDMTMPSFDIAADEDGGRPQAYGGQELVRYMKKRHIDVPVVLLTQFDAFGKEPNQRTLTELRAELQRDYGDLFLGAIHYNVSVDSWRDELRQAILRLSTRMS